VKENTPGPFRNDSVAWGEQAFAAWNAHEAMSDF
jgi:hypothetical protein